MQDEYFITRLTAVFFSYLTAALLIERFVEVVMAVLRYLELRLKWPKWLKIAETLQVRLERFYHLQTGGAKALDTLLWNWVTVAGESGKRILAADLIRLRYYRLVSYALTFSAALVLAFFIDYNLIEIITDAYPEVLKVFDPRKYAGLNVLLTACALSFGVQPLHQLISRLEKRLEKKLQPGGAQ